MKNFFLICVATVLVLGLTGCPFGHLVGNKDDASSTQEFKAGATAAPGNGMAAQDAAGSTDATATGGSNLPASTPYKHGGASAQQNVNATPFMTATQPAGKNPAQPSDLISRADGTMMGPNDQLAAGTGPEGMGMNSAVPKKAPAPAKAAAKPAEKK